MQKRRTLASFALVGRGEEPRSPRYCGTAKLASEGSLDQGRLGCLAHLGLGDAFGQLYELQAALDHVEDPEVGDNAVDHRV